MTGKDELLYSSPVLAAIAKASYIGGYLGSLWTTKIFGKVEDGQLRPDGGTISLAILSRIICTQN